MFPSWHGVVCYEGIIPELNGENERVLAALNQAGVAMKTGRHWYYEKGEPNKALVKFLKKI